MKYLKISNKGELDARLISLMGGTTKAEDPNKIGQFGTGLKYAISFMVRSEISFKLFVGEKEVIFQTKDEEISGQQFKEIYCDGRSMNITTRYGYQWKPWEAIREIWCNAKDEGGEQKKITSDGSVISGIKGRTTFFIEYTKDIEDVITNWNSFFLSNKPIFENDKVGIYLNEDKHLKLYKNRVLVHTDQYYKSLFMYDLKNSDLNELRQYRGYASHDMVRSILQSNKEVVEHLVNSIHKGEDKMELKLDWSGLSYNREVVKDIFQGYRFLHPLSDKPVNKKSVIVNETLFQLLSDCGLPCEQIKTRSGGYYGGGGYGYKSEEKVSFTPVSNDSLHQRITQILKNFKCYTSFKIAVPRDSDFEIMVTPEGFIFSSDLDRTSNADLEATVLIAIFHHTEGNMYKAFKRLVKFARSNKSFEKILFGNK